MKKILYSLFFILPALFVSCEKEMHEGLVVIYDESNPVPSEGGTTTFRIDTDASWRIEFDEMYDSEIEVSQTSGKGSATITVKVVYVNEDAEPIRYPLLVIAGGDIQPVSIMQAPAPLVFELSKETINASWEADNYSVEITTNSTGSWMANKEDYLETWYSITNLDPFAGSFDISVSEAVSTTETRRAKVLVEVWYIDDYVTKEIEIIQQPKLD